MRLFTLLVSAVFVAIGIWGIRDGDSEGWWIAGFFGLCLLVALPDEWILLDGDHAGCSFPTEVSEMDRFWDELELRFPGFDYQPIIRGGTEDAKHLCWERQQSASRST